MATERPEQPERPKAPTEPPMQTLEPRTGPNVDGLNHMAQLAHAADDEARAALAQRLTAEAEAARVRETEARKQANEIPAEILDIPKET